MMQKSKPVKTIPVKFPIKKQYNKKTMTHHNQPHKPRERPCG